MQSPAVSFVVPCYKLAHFLPECVRSILDQTFRDLEVIILDDCSPDNTADVAQSFADARVRYVRNETNLGALRNYNKGISLSRGRYVWLISADDYLRVSYVLQRYVDLMEAHPRVSYVFCPAVQVQNGREAGLLRYSTCGAEDRVVPGRAFLRTLLRGNRVVAPTAMARRDCYEKISDFPLDPVWGGVTLDLLWGADWYLWCMFALHGDVAYFNEPMVAYRLHESSSTHTITKEKIENCYRAEVSVPWQIKKNADRLGMNDVSKACLKGVAFVYAQHLTTKQYPFSESTVTMAQVEESFRQNDSTGRERSYIRAHVYSDMGEILYHRGEFGSAKKCYRAATNQRPWMLRVQAKRFLLALGKPGRKLREALRRAR